MTIQGEPDLTVYFVDEDYPKFRAWLAELEYRGLRVRTIGDADRAYEQLSRANDVDWVIIDVMLAAAETKRSRYEATRTDGSLETGLTLLRDLVGVRPEIFPKHAQLLTNTTNQRTYAAAQRCAEEFGIDLIEKTQIENARDFGDRVASALVKLRETSESA